MISLKTGWILLCIASILSGYETCYEYSSFQQRTFTCTYSCCGTSSSRYCCSGSSSGSTTGLIIGIVVGVGSLIAVIVGIVLCCVCCCRSSQGHQGQVVSTTSQQLTVISAGTNPPTGAYNAGYVHTAQFPPGTSYPLTAGMAQPPPPYSPQAHSPMAGQGVIPPMAGQGNPPMAGQGAIPPMAGQGNPPMAGQAAYPPMAGQGNPPMAGQAAYPPPGPAANPPMAGQGAYPPPSRETPPATTVAPKMCNDSERSKAMKTNDTDEHVYTALEW